MSLPLPWGGVGGRLGVAVFVAGALGWALWRHHRRELLAALLAVGLADATSTWVLKPWVGRPRPCAVDPGVRARGEAVGVPCGAGRSFPSNHAANTAAVAAALASPPLVVVSLVVGASRVVLGQHHPSDVLAGWVLGAGIGLGLRRALRVAPCPSAPSSSTPPTPS